MSETFLTVENATDLVPTLPVLEPSMPGDVLADEPAPKFEVERLLAGKLRRGASLAIQLAFDAQARDEFLHKEIDRRDMLGGLAASAGLAAAAGAAMTIRRQEERIGDALSEIWPKNKPSFTFLNGANYQGQNELAIYLPGFGDMHSKSEAQLWKDTSELPEDFLTGFMDYSNEGATLKDIVGCIRSSIDMKKVSSVTFVGRSIGGLFALPIAAELGIPVKSMLLMSAPSRLENGDFGNFGKLAADAPKNRAIATLFKFGFNTWRAYRKNGADLPTNIAEGWESAFSGASSTALQTELKTAAPIDVRHSSLRTQLRKVFIPGYSKVAYAATDHPSSDETVLVVASGEEFKEAFDDLDIDFRLVGVPYRGHANVAATATNMKRWTQSTTSSTRVLASK